MSPHRSKRKEGTDSD